MANENKRRAKRTFIGIETVIDSISGEVLQEYKKFIDRPNGKTTWCTMYLSDDNIFEALSGLGSQGKVWAYVLKAYDGKTGVFNFSSMQKMFMIKELGLSIGTIRSSMSGFCKSGLLKRVMGADYVVNPNIFYKGDWNKREAMIKIYNSLNSKNEKMDSGD